MHSHTCTTSRSLSFRCDSVLSKSYQESDHSSPTSASGVTFRIREILYYEKKKSKHSPLKCIYSFHFLIPFFPQTLLSQMDQVKCEIKRNVYAILYTYNFKFSSLSYTLVQWRSQIF